MKKNITLALVLLLLTGCQGLTSTQKPVSIYSLRYVGEVAERSASSGSGIMVVSEPTLPSGMETDKIALYLDGGRRLDYYADARWPESLEDVLQDVMVQAGRQSLPHMVVDTPKLNVPANYRLAVKVLDFAPVYQASPDRAPMLKVAMNFTLIQLPSKKILTDFVLEGEQVAAGNDMASVTTGLENLLQGMLTESFEKIRTGVDRASK